jgi:hypothetical protein
LDASDSPSFAERGAFHLGAVNPRRAAGLFAHAGCVVIGEPGTLAKRAAFEVEAHHRRRERVPRTDRINNGCGWCPL